MQQPDKIHSLQKVEGANSKSDMEWKQQKPWDLSFALCLLQLVRKYFFKKGVGLESKSRRG